MTDSFSPFSAVYKFAGGLGTEAHPYLIANAEQLNAMRDFVETEEDGETIHSYVGGIDRYYKMIADIDATANDWAPIGYAKYEAVSGGVQLVTDERSMDFCSAFDGNHHTLKIKFDGTTAYLDEVKPTIALFGYTNSALITDLTLDVNIDTTNLNQSVSAAGFAGTSFGTDYTNVIVTGSIKSGASAAGFANTDYGSVYTNCTNNANLTSVRAIATKTNYSFIAGFCGQAVSYREDENNYAYVTIFKNCVNNGNLTYIKENPNVTSYGVSMGGIFGQGWSYDPVKTKLIDCKNNGTITGHAKGTTQGNERYEGVSKDGATSYDTEPNRYKELVGGFFSGGIIIEENEVALDLTSYQTEDYFKCGS